MNSTTLRNSSGQTIGFLYYLGNHRTEIRNAVGLVLGWHNPTSDITYQANGVMVGRGNLLTFLLS